MRTDPKDAGQSRFLHRVFTTVPPRYDLINHLMTLGMDIGWRRIAARECLANSPERVLDLCCGTGDLALTTASLGGGRARVLGIDYSRPMLTKAAGKAARRGTASPDFICGDIAALPFPDDCFDSVGTSFAFRNLTYRNPRARKYLAEVLRVLRKGGRFVIVESSRPEPRARLVRRLHEAYVRRFVFWLGWFISGSRESYAYLADSVSHYYNAEELRALLLAAGFSRVSFARLFWGAAAVHVAAK
jgi:demethylmenaquinone methyltransferase/2-methoxy-6-polyprenyl-1,4-benzoquinol methylase